MRRTAIMTAVMIGMTCCAISLIGARADAPRVPVPPHQMRGWVHAPAEP